MRLDTESIWLIVGFGGQAIFGLRFIVQWILSEREGESVIPIAFWYFSIGGGITLTVYAVHIMDPVFIFGQGLGLLIYFRNLQLIFRSRRMASPRED